MFYKITQFAGLWWVNCLLLSLTAWGQQTTHPFASKANRSSVPVNTGALKPVVINGQVAASNGRIAVVNRSALSGRPLSLPSRLATVPDGFEVKKSTQTGLPIFIKGIAPHSANARIDARQASVTYLDAVKDVMQIRNPALEFEVSTLETDGIGQSHQRMRQLYRGIPVYGGEVVLHSENGLIHALNGRHYPTPDMADVHSVISQSQAIQVATRDLSMRTTFYDLPTAQRKLLDYGNGPESRLVIYHPNEGLKLPRLAWHVSVRPNLIELWEYFVDAKSGTVIHQHNHTCSIDGGRTATAKDLNGITRTINTYQAGTSYYFMDASRSMFSLGQSKFPEEPVGIIWTMDAKNTHGKDLKVDHIISGNNSWNNPGAVSSHYNGGQAFEYYKTVHTRNSINGQGGNVISLINVTDDDGKGMDNAYWNGKAMFYGNGNTSFKPLAGALDVGGHEMTHGVISNSANLEYQGQSGAINESMADVFGAMIDNANWTMGEGVVLKSAFPSGALRDLSNPHNGGTSLNNRGYQPAVLTELYTGDQDNGGVHINSGIPNFAFFKFATAVTKAKAEKVYYRALTQYLTAKSQFIDLRLAVIQAATDLHGANSAEVNAAKTAFDQVGITDGASTGDGNVELPDNPGQEFILMHDASATDPNTWYTARPDGSNLVAKSTTEAKNRPSVTDDGSVAAFVSRDGKIRSLTLTSTPTENIVQDDAIWDNVAVSKDGTKVAAITTSADTSIYVYDFGKKEWRKFKLYNPTYTEGVNASGVRFADAIEWDYTGENLVYDAYNVLNKPTGESIDYWDVGIIRVWDNAKKDFGDGKIKKVFTNLPENVSIGNPAFSKKSPSIVAFDYVDSKANTYKLIAANLTTGDVGVVVENTILSYPTYSKADDKMAFTTLNDQGDTVVAVIPLKADKINPNGTVTVIITEAKWAVWYAQGDRQVLSAEKDMTQFAFPLLNPAVIGTITVNNIVVTVADTVNVTKLIAKFISSPLSTVKVDNAVQVSSVTKNNFSQPVTYTVTAQDGTTKNYVVTVIKGVGTGVGDLNDESDKVALFPNPNDGHFKLAWDRVETAPIQLEIVTATGQPVHQQTIPAYQTNREINLQLPGVRPGLYLLHMRSNGKAAYKKLVVK